MAYCTHDDLVKRVGADDLARLADHDGDGMADSEVVARAVNDADALIDSYLRVRFDVPVSAGGEVPDVLRTRAVNLALYFLHLGRDSVTEDVRRQYEDDVAWLREAAAGHVSLGVDPSPEESQEAIGVRYQSRPRVFGRGEPL